MPLRQSLSKHGIELSYLEWKEGKKPLLLLHGLADNALVWLQLAEHLAPDYHIIAPDMRGHGDSSKPKSDYTFASAIADLEALMDHLGWSSAQVVSHSWTGKLAVIWARNNPQRLRSMVLVDPIFIWKMPSLLRLTFPLLYRYLPFLKTMGPFTSYSEAEAQARQLYQYQGWNSLQQQVFQAGIEQKPDGSWGSKFTVAARDGIFADVLSVPGFIHPIDTPTLFVQPEKGLNRQEWQIQPYKKHLKNFRLCQVPGNHWPFLTQPEAFNRTIAAFLREHK
ncbi:alpha/beta hydrolase [Chrysosporum bergii ANA360D]|jgi:haloacetate dehalogenase|uniref:Alpha/beta hydrolase n=1 Tax=Chrysosporum bergii ANA360D TaxID=617107 RepID=A0AA43GTN7_9CYAN|nr:alpha/beta hydrolase [Chrysosporum bergii]MDH6061220.1 alpha/beta hydrolase [Chrysosporum bergii ANA360D]